MGGSSGGGGSSGKVDYPGYMKDVHRALLGSGAVTTDMTALINQGLESSPFLTITAFDPGTLIQESLLAVSDTWTYIENLDSTAMINAVSNSVNQHLVDVTLPEFRSGARDMGVVLSSAFAVGESLIYNRASQEIAKIASEIPFKKSDLMLRASELQVEARRIAIVAKKEHIDQVTALDEADAKWPFELYTYAGNLLASIGGAAVQSKSDTSKMQSAIGGALSGAAMGATTGNPLMIGAGAALGFAGGLF